MYKDRKNGNFRLFVPWYDGGTMIDHVGRGVMNVEEKRVPIMQLMMRNLRRRIYWR